MGLRNSAPTSVSEGLGCDDAVTATCVGQGPRPNAASRAALPTKSIASRYEVVELLGRGGMGVVYRVHDRSTGEQVALKQLHVRPTDSGAARASALFEGEYYTLAQLAHPRVIAVYDYGVDGRGPFYTMELLDGGDLRDIAPVGVKRACELMLDVCSSLALLHSRRLVHRDVSPRNVRWTEDGHAKLIDFGAMVAMGPCAHTVGTPAFIAPEVLHRATLDGRTDLFSLGAVLYHALTGRTPFAAQAFADLRQAWGREPVRPSQWVEGIPASLDALCASLLRIDPAQRPTSVFEVMQRLKAAGGIQSDESFEVSLGYLATPVLTGREPALRQFRRGMRNALHGMGGCLCFEGDAGSGRSRMLDACALQAKTLGAIVLRASPAKGEALPLAVAQQLGDQLLQMLPQAALEAAERAGVSEELLCVPSADSPHDSSGSACLRELAGQTQGRAELQASLIAWLLSVAERHAVVLAVDDIEGVDEPSTALLAGLAMRAAEGRILIAYARDGGRSDRPTTAQDVLAAHSVSVPLSALSAGDTGSLLLSVFGDVPNLRLLSDRLYKLALGSPRDTLTIAQHLLDQSVVRYEDAQWTLPGTLADSDLPANASEVLEARVAALPPLARRLIESHALLGILALRRQDYVDLVPQAAPCELEAAIAELLAEQLVGCDGEFYSLCHRSLGEALRARLTGEQLRDRHRALHAFHQARGAHSYVLAQHLLGAGEHDQALDLLATHGGTAISSDNEVGDTRAFLRLDLGRVAVTLAHCLALSEQRARPMLQTMELRRWLLELCPSHDASLHGRHGPGLLAQLELDSGLVDYRAFDPGLEPSVRLQQALHACMTRYGETLEQTRVYPLDQAIRHLGAYAVISMAIAIQAWDGRLLTTLPPLLEPFASLSPALHALWQLAQACCQLNCLGRNQAAIKRLRRTYDRLGEVDGNAVAYVDTIRLAVATRIGLAQLEHGRDTAFVWAALLDDVPYQRAPAMQLRQLACAYRGDTAGAARYARAAEARSLEVASVELLPRPWREEFWVASLAGEVEGLKRVIEGVAVLAVRYPGWVPLRTLAEGRLQGLCGELEKAQQTHEKGIAMCGPQAGARRNLDLWAKGCSGLVSVLIAGGKLQQAVTVGSEALASARALEVELGWHALACQLALAEAKLGQCEAAAQRIDEVLEEQRTFDMYGLSVARACEARARVAICAGDAATAQQYTVLAAKECGDASAAAASTPMGQLLSEAKEAGLPVELSPSAFEVSVLGTTEALNKTQQTPVISRRVSDGLAKCTDPASRAQASLDLLCAVAGAASGHLYLVGADGTLGLVASRDCPAPDGHGLAFAQGFFEQQLDDAAMTGAFTQVTHLDSLPGAASYVDPQGQEHGLFMLLSRRECELVHVGLAVLAPGTLSHDPAAMLVEAPAVASALLAAGDTPGVRPSEEGVE